jgi:hypothetical protein
LRAAALIQRELIEGIILNTNKEALFPSVLSAGKKESIQNLYKSRTQFKKKRCLSLMSKS